MDCKKLVSVIIPIYNVEKQLRRCIESVRNQTYSNLEIILIDDGSPDGCGKICDEYLEIDSRVKVIHKKNGGLGYARNSGLEVSTGYYVVFVDSDDYLKAEYIELLSENAVRYRADLVTCGFIRKYNDGSEKENPIISIKCVYNDGEILSKIILPMTGASPELASDVEREMSVWINLYRKDIIDKNSLRFVSEREYVSEDFFFNTAYFNKVKTGVLIPECLYYYSENPNSLTNSYRADRFEKYCKMYRKQVELLKEYNYMDAAEIRLKRTFIMKSKKSIASIEASNLRFREKLKKTDKILNNALLIQIINRYPINKYTRVQRIPVLLMKYKCSFAILMLYKIKKRKAKKGYCTLVR